MKTQEQVKQSNQPASPLGSPRSASPSIKSQNQQPQTQGQESKNSSNNEIQPASPLGSPRSADSSEMEIVINDGTKNLQKSNIDQKNNKQSDVMYSGLFLGTLFTIAGIVGASTSTTIVPIITSTITAAIGSSLTALSAIKIYNSSREEVTKTRLSQRSEAQQQITKQTPEQTPEPTPEQTPKQITKQTPEPRQTSNQLTAIEVNNTTVEVNNTINPPVANTTQETRLTRSRSLQTQTTTQQPNPNMNPTNHAQIGLSRSRSI